MQILYQSGGIYMSDIKLILTFENAKDYIKAVESNEDMQEACKNI